MKTCWILCAVAIVVYWLGYGMRASEDRGSQVELQSLEAEHKKTLSQVDELEKKMDVLKLLIYELSKFIRATDKFVLEHPELADDFPRHPFRVEEKIEDEEEEQSWK